MTSEAREHIVFRVTIITCIELWFKETASGGVDNLQRRHGDSSVQKVYTSSTRWQDLRFKGFSHKAEKLYVKTPVDGREELVN